MKTWLILAAVLSAQEVWADTRDVYLETNAQDRILIAQLDVSETGSYTVRMQDDAFGDHFLSMRPFKCLEGPDKHWCHVPYPYENKRDISDELTDLEYDFMFVWKGATEYGINMWNGVYYKLEDSEGALTGALFEMDMNQLAVPPDAGELRPVKASDLHESDPDGHWLPRLVIE